MALDSSRTHIRTIAIIGAGAALLAMIGYLLMKSDQKKPRRKSSKTSNTESNKNTINSTSNIKSAEDTFNMDSKSNDTNKNTIIELNKSLAKIVIDEKSYDDHVVPDLEKTKWSINTQSERIRDEELLRNKIQNQSVEQDKLSDTSSDSGNGQSETHHQDGIEIEEVDEDNGCAQVTPTSSYNQTNLINRSNSNQSLKTVSQNLTSDENNQCEIVTNNNNETIVTTDSANKQQVAMSTSSTLSSIASDTSNKSSRNFKSNKHKSNHLVYAKTSNENESKKDTYEDLVVYEFNFPRKYCGKLIGKNGIHVDYIRSKTHTQIAVRNDPNVEEQQIVCVSGRLEDVDHALDIINTRFSSKHYPNITLKPISKPIVYRRYNPENKETFSDSKVLVAPNMFVDISSAVLSASGSSTSASDEEKNNNTDMLEANVHVTAVVSAVHVFIQLPMHPTYENLQKLDQNMLKLYGNLNEHVPLMNEPIEYGTICVAPTSYGWHRAMVTNFQSKEDVQVQIPDYAENCGLATVKFLDYGGYLTIPSNQLRQLR
jgi:A-kinase anchor protein 1